MAQPGQKGRVMPLEKGSVAKIVQKTGLTFGDPVPLPSGHYVKGGWQFDGNGDGSRCHIVKFIPVDSRTTEADMDALVNMVMGYRAALTQYKVPTVPIHSLFHHFDDLSNGRKFLVEISGYGGPPVDDSIKAGDPSEAIALLQKILNAVEALFIKQGHNHLLPVGLNLIPRNFAVDNGQVRYIDFFVPYLFPIHSWPPTNNPLIVRLDHWRHYDVRGLLQVLLVQSGKLRPELYYEFDYLIERQIKDWQIGIATWWVERPARQVANQVKTGAKTKTVQVIGRLPIHSLYDLREIGVLMTSLKMLAPDELERLFTETHCHSDEPPNQERFRFWRDSLANHFKV